MDLFFVRDLYLSLSVDLNFSTYRTTVEECKLSVRINID